MGTPRSGDRRRTGDAALLVACRHCGVARHLELPRIEVEGDRVFHRCQACGRAFPIRASDLRCLLDGVPDGVVADARAVFGTAPKRG